MPTIVLRTIVTSSEVLARRLLTKVDASWAYTNSTLQIVSVNPSATVNLPANTTYVIEADPLATVVVGWVFSANTVEIPLNGITVVAPPATPYLRNTSSSGNAVPVKVLSFT